MILLLNDYNGFVVLDMCVLRSVCTPGTHSAHRPSTEFDPSLHAMFNSYGVYRFLGFT